MENNEPQELKFEHIYVTMKYVNGEKKLDFLLNGGKYKLK